MKKNLLIVLLGAFTAIITLTSSSTGPAHTDNLNRSAAGCGGAGCHNTTNSNNTIVGLVVVDKASGQTVSNFKYTPGKAYRLYLLGNSLSGLTKFGFQITCVQKLAQTLQAGTFSNYPSTTWSKSIGGIQIIEHGSTLSTNAQGIDSVMMDWTAPAATAGTVRFYYMLNAVNGDHTSGGDEWNGTFTELDPVSTGVDDVSKNKAVSVYPNPTAEYINVPVTQSGRYDLWITDGAGRICLSKVMDAEAATPLQLSVGSLPAGQYHILLHGPSENYSGIFMKQ